MTAYPNEAVQAAANKLMAALALHEDCRGAVTDALHDMWDAGHASAQQPPTPRPTNAELRSRKHVCFMHDWYSDDEPCPDCAQFAALLARAEADGLYRAT